MLASAKILLILASFLVANSQGSQHPKVSTFKPIEVSSDSSTLTSKEIDTDSSEISSDSTEASTQLDIFSGTEETEVAKSNEILSGDLVSEVYIVPSSSATPTTESILFLDVPWDEISASSDHKGTTLLPRLNETSLGISNRDSTETSTEFNIPSGTEDYEVAKSSEIQSGDLSSEMYSPSLSLEAFALLTEAPVVLPNDDSPEISTEVDISSGTEKFEGPKSNEIPSGDMTSEIDTVPPSSATPTTEPVLFPDVSMDEIIAFLDHKRTTALPRLTEAPIEISIEDPTQTTNKIDISSGTEEFEELKSSEIPSGDMSSEIDTVPPSSATPPTERVLFPDVSMDEILAFPHHKRTTALPRLTEAPIEISIEDPTETTNKIDISSGTEAFEELKPSEIPSGDMTSEIDTVPPSSATPTTEPVLFPYVSMDEVIAFLDHKRTTALPRLTEAPIEISIEDPTETTNKIEISSGTEEFEELKSSEIPSGDLSSEIDTVPRSSATPPTERVLFPDVSMNEILAFPDHKRTTALPRLTKAHIEISTENPTRTTNKIDISSGTEEFEELKPSEIPSGDMNSETDTLPPSSATPPTEPVLFPDVSMDEILAFPHHKRTTALPKLTKANVAIAFGNPTRTTNKIDISSGTEAFKDIQMPFDIAMGPPSTAVPTTKPVVFTDAPMEQFFSFPEPERTTESVEPEDFYTTPSSSQNPTTIMLDFTFPSTTSKEFVDSNDSVKPPEEQVSDAYNISKPVLEITAKEEKINFGVLFGVILGFAVGAALFATVPFLLYRKRKICLFAHQRFFDERNESVHRLDNTTDTYYLSFGGTSFFNSAVPDDPVMEKNTERAGENIQMKTIPPASTLNKPWGIGLQNTESHFMPRTVSNP